MKIQIRLENDDVRRIIADAIQARLSSDQQVTDVYVYSWGNAEVTAEARKVAHDAG